MTYEKMVRIPSERIGVLIGREGTVKSKIEESCGGCTIDVNGQSGEVYIKSEDTTDLIAPFKATEIVTAIGRGFSADVAMALLKDENVLHVIDLREFAGKSTNSIERVKGRIIGEGGRARRNMEQLTSTRICVYGKTVSVIGETIQLYQVIEAIRSLSGGSMHGTVYNKLESANRRQKQDRMQLWEDKDGSN